MKKKLNVIILTGAVNSGKTTWLKKLVDEYSASLPEPPAGILSIGEFSGDFKSYYMQDILTGGRYLLAGKKEMINEGIECGRFSFSQSAFKKGNEILLALINYPSLVIADEAGFLELNEAGFYQGITALIQSPPEYLIITVRENLVEKIIEKFGIVNPSIIRAGEYPDIRRP